MDLDNSVPLVIDLDGTLVTTDTLVESALDSVHRQPATLFQLSGWLSGGKAVLKQRLAERSQLDYAKLPYHPEVIALINQARDQGRSVVLASACDQKIADGVANSLGLFDDVIASDGTVNRSAQNKKDVLVARYGEQGFDYAGNSSDDLVVWQAARNAIVVAASASVARQARKRANVISEIGLPSTSESPLLKALRPHQWAKNALILVPLLASHAFDTASILSAILAIICFCLVASGTYLINDLLDIQDDRSHVTKCRRPFAAGSLHPLSGVFWSAGLVGTGILIAATTLPWLFLVATIAYLLITLSYSFLLKSIMALDVITLTVLYTLRIVAGSLALNMEPTFWILTFSLFIFLSLALVKRYAELNDARQKGKTEKSAGRGYYPADLEIIAQMGVANGFMSILFFALYIHDPATTALYSDSRVLWLVCPVLMYWICRLWLLTHRGQMHDDPVVFAIKDRVSLLTLVAVGVIFLTAL